MADDLTIALKYNIPFAQLGYFPPSRSSKPKRQCSIDVWKEGTILKTISLNDKEYYVLGRNNELCDITLSNPTVSRVHCVLQHRDNGNLYIYDLKTAYGTYVSKNKIEPQSYVRLSPGETFCIANSTKMFIVNCEGDNEDDEDGDGGNKNNGAYVREEGNSHISASNSVRQIMKSNYNAKIEFNNESNWGIKDNDAEIEQYQIIEDNKDDMDNNNNNNININEILQRDNLTPNQRRLIEKITQLVNERDHITKESESLKNTEYDYAYSYDYDFNSNSNANDNQKKKIERKKYYFTKRLKEIKESLEDLKHKLTESLRSSEENSLRFNRKLYKEGNDGDNDEYYDRTKFIKGTEAKQSTTEVVINYESMKATLESLIKEKQKYIDLLSHTNTSKEKDKGIDKYKEKAIELDSIDQYFIDNEIETKTENIKEKLESIENEIKKTEQLLDYVTPLHLKIKRNAEVNNTNTNNKANTEMLPSFNSNSKRTNNNNKQQQSKGNKKKESIAEVISKMNRLQNEANNVPNSNAIEANENNGDNNQALNEQGNEALLDDEMIDKLNEYKNMLKHNEDKDKDKRRKDQLEKTMGKKKEASLFKEIVANIGKSNFEVANYPQIISRYESLKETKEKKESKPIAYINPDDAFLDNDDDDDALDNLNQFQGKKKNRDEMKPNRQQIEDKDRDKDKDELEPGAKGKWIEETISDNPFNTYVNNKNNNDT